MKKLLVLFVLFSSLDYSCVWAGKDSQNLLEVAEIYDQAGAEEPNFFHDGIVVDESTFVGLNVDWARPQSLPENNFLSVFKKEQGIWGPKWIWVDTLLVAQILGAHTINLNIWKYNNNKFLISDSQNNRIVETDRQGRILWDSSLLGVEIRTPNEAEYSRDGTGVLIGCSKDGVGRGCFKVAWDGAILDYLLPPPGDRIIHDVNEYAPDEITLVWSSDDSC